VFLVTAMAQVRGLGLPHFLRKTLRNVQPPGPRIAINLVPFYILVTCNSLSLCLISACHGLIHCSPKACASCAACFSGIRGLCFDL
jgi:hypothetical protein